MAITHPTTVRNSLADLVVDLIDAGAGAGKVEIGTSGFSTTLATITLSDPAFGAAASGTATANGMPAEDSSAAGGGTAAEMRVRDSNDNDVFSGTVTATSGGGDLELSSTTINMGDAVRINSFTYTAPA